MKARFKGPVVGGSAGRDMIVINVAPSCLTEEELALVQAWRTADESARDILRLWAEGVAGHSCDDASD